MKKIHHRQQKSIFQVRLLLEGLPVHTDLADHNEASILANIIDK